MTTWNDVLSHRPESSRGPVIDRFNAAGLTPEDVARVMPSGPPIELFSDVADPNGMDPLGGALGAALLAAELDAKAVLIRSVAAQLRHVAVNELTREESVAEVARMLGQTRQAVSRVANGPSVLKEFIQDIKAMTERGMK
jgi:hypothetical protein